MSGVTKWGKVTKWGHVVMEAIGSNGTCNIRKLTRKGQVKETHSVTHCLGVRLGLGFRFRVGVPESRMGWDGASASRSLHRLVFRVRYLAIGRGHVVGHDGKAVDSEDGDRHEWRAKHRGR